MSTLREDFEAWYRVMFAENPNRPGALTEWLAYQAATERAAKKCDSERAEFSERAAQNNGRESDFAFGSVNSAERLAAAIRGGDGVAR